MKIATDRASRRRRQDDCGGNGTVRNRLVKRDGKWFIQFRKLTVFTD